MMAPVLLVQPLKLRPEYALEAVLVDPGRCLEAGDEGREPAAKIGLLLSEPAASSDKDRFRELSKEYSRLGQVAEEFDAYRKLGNGFVTAGGGVLFSLGADAALQVNLNAMLMTPSVGFVLQP